MGHGVYKPTVVAHGDWWPATAVGEPPRRLDLTVVDHDGYAQPPWATAVGVIFYKILLNMVKGPLVQLLQHNRVKFKYYTALQKR
jgi:hypothetical protein